jgi:hypothetical protein
MDHLRGKTVNNAPAVDAQLVVDRPATWAMGAATFP